MDKESKKIELTASIEREIVFIDEFTIYLDGNLERILEEQKTRYNPKFTIFEANQKPNAWVCEYLKNLKEQDNEKL